MKIKLKKDYKIVSLVALREYLRQEGITVKDWHELDYTPEQEADLLPLLTDFQIKYYEKEIKKGL